VTRYRSLRIRYELSAPRIVQWSLSIDGIGGMCKICRMRVHFLRFRALSRPVNGSSPVQARERLPGGYRRYGDAPVAGEGVKTTLPLQCSERSARNRALVIEHATGIVNVDARQDPTSGNLLMIRLVLAELFSALSLAAIIWWFYEPASVYFQFNTERAPVTILLLIFHICVRLMSISIDSIVQSVSARCELRKDLPCLIENLEARTSRPVRVTAIIEALESFQQALGRFRPRHARKIGALIAEIKKLTKYQSYDAVPMPMSKEMMEHCAEVLASVL